LGEPLLSGTRATAQRKPSIERSEQRVESAGSSVAEMSVGRWEGGGGRRETKSKEGPHRHQCGGEATRSVLRAPDERVDVRVGLPRRSAEVGVDRLGAELGRRYRERDVLLPGGLTLAQPAGADFDKSFRCSGGGLSSPACAIGGGVNTPPPERRWLQITAKAGSVRLRRTHAKFPLDRRLRRAGVRGEGNERRHQSPATSPTM